MEVHVLSLDWCLEMPVATVVSTTNAIFRLCLLHRSFLQRHHIGIGSRLQISDTGFFQKVLEATGGATTPPSRTAFDAWFVLYPQLIPFMSKRVARILFMHGLQTVDAIGRYRQSVEDIHGVGPVAARQIREMCTSLVQS